MKRIIWIALSYLVQIASAQAAGFDCAKAKTKTEKLLCEPANSFVEHYDNQLNIAYQWALVRADDPEKLRKAQRHWLRAVRDVCDDGHCLKDVILARTHELEALTDGTGCYTLSPIFDNGPSGSIRPIEPVCLALEKNLNRFCDQPPMACGLKIAPEFRDQLSLPAWTPLDPQANRALIEEFIRAPWQVASAKGADNQRWEKERPDVDKALAEKRLTFSQANVDLFNLGRAQPAYRLDYGSCAASNPQFRDRSKWGGIITPAAVQIHHAPHVIRSIFKQYFPLQHEALNEIFIYRGQVYDFAMAGTEGAFEPDADKLLAPENRFGVGRHERWVIPGEKNAALHISNVCQFIYRPIQVEQK